MTSPEADIEAVKAHHQSTVVYPEATHGFMRDGSDSQQFSGFEERNGQG